MMIAGPPVAEIGKPAPSFALRTLDGRRVTLETYRGRTLVINVWGSWCPPCRLETAGFEAEAAADAREGVVFLGVDTTEPVAAVRAYVAAKGIDYPQAVVASGSDFERRYEITNLPTTIVIDPRGIVRARHADNILPRAQLHAYIVAARDGHSAPLVSAQQRRLDAMLALSRYHFEGGADAVVADARRAAKAISAAEDIQDDAMDDPSRDHDLDKTHAEESSLRGVAIAALAPVAKTSADRALLATLRGDQAAADLRWPQATGAYAQALAIDPKDLDALGGLAYAADELGENEREVTLDAKIAALAPSYSSFIGLALAQAKVGNRAAAYASLARAVALAKSDQHLAWTHLYGGRAALRLHDTARARAEFLAAGAAAGRMARSNPIRPMYFEEAEEGAVAAGLTRGTTSLAIAPWTGPDLPGSIASTYKYRLALSGAAGARIALHASGLPKGWIGSFCSDRICSPFNSTVVLPSLGVKIVEFQIVPGPGPTPTGARIAAAQAGRTVATVRAVVRNPGLARPVS